MGVRRGAQAHGGAGRRADVMASDEGRGGRRAPLPGNGRAWGRRRAPLQRAAVGAGRGRRPGLRGDPRPGLPSAPRPRPVQPRAAPTCRASGSAAPRPARRPLPAGARATPPREQAPSPCAPLLRGAARAGRPGGGQGQARSGSPGSASPGRARALPPARPEARTPRSPAAPGGSLKAFGTLRPSLSSSPQTWSARRDPRVLGGRQWLLPKRSAVLASLPSAGLGCQEPRAAHLVRYFRSGPPFGGLAREGVCFCPGPGRPVLSSWAREGGWTTRGPLRSGSWCAQRSPRQPTFPAPFRAHGEGAFGPNCHAPYSESLTL